MTAKAGVFISIRSALTDDRGFKKTNANLRAMQGEARQSSRAVETSSAKSNKALSTLTGGFAATGKAAKLMHLAVGGGAALAGAAIVGFAMKSSKAYLDVTRSVREFQRYAGGTAEQASQLVFATKRLGIEPANAAKAMFQLSKRLGDGQVDLHKYGIEVKRNADGSVDMKDAVLKLSGALSKMDANKRAATVFELFGRQGAVLLPLLSKNRHELEQIFDLAGKDHQIFSQKDLDQSVAYQKSLAEMQLAWQGLEIQIGRAVLPVLKGAIDTFTPLASLISDNADAAQFLGKVVGGPLLVGLTAITAVKIGRWAADGIKPLAGLGSKLFDLVGRASTGSIAMQGFGATTLTLGTDVAEAGAVAAPGWIALLGPLALGIGIAGAVSAGLLLIMKAVGYLDDDVNKSAKHAKSWAANHVAAWKKVADGPQRAQLALDRYRKHNAELERQLKRVVVAQGNEGVAMREFGVHSSQAWKIQKRLNAELETGRARLGQLERQAGPWIKALRHAGAEVRRTGVEIAGLKIPPNLLAGLDAKKIQSFTTDLETSISVFGAWSTQMLLNSGIGVEALKALTKEAQQTDAQIESSFRSATTVVGAFGNETVITGDQFMAKLQDMNASAHDFANKLAIAAAVGVDQGLLKSIAEAGPKAAPELNALLDAVHTHGVQAINDTQTDTNTALDQIKGTINGRIAGDAATGYAYGQAVGQAMGAGLAAAAGAAVDSAIREVMRRLGSMFGGGGGGGNGGRIRTALGGPRKAGQVLWVGEAGPEAMVMPSNGQVLSHSEAYAAVREASAAARGGLAGGVSGGNASGASVVIQVDARGAVDPAATRAAAERGARAGAGTALRQLTVLARGR